MKPAHAMVLAASFVGLVLGPVIAWRGDLFPARTMTPECAAPARAMARLELFFGTSRPDGSHVTRAAWNRFLDTVVTPRFPDGLTVLEGAGQWRGSDGQLTKEKSYVLVIWHAPGRRTESDIAAIRTAYKQTFQQESVMRIDGRSCVSF